MLPSQTPTIPSMTCASIFFLESLYGVIVQKLHRWRAGYLGQFQIDVLSLAEVIDIFLYTSKRAKVDAGAIHNRIIISKPLNEKGW